MDSVDDAWLYQLPTMHSLPSSSTLHLVALLTKILVQLAPPGKVPRFQLTFVTSFHCATFVLMCETQELLANFFPPASGPALVPLNDPMVLVNGQQSLEKVNLYRDGTGQPHADNNNASGITYWYMDIHY